MTTTNEHSIKRDRILSGIREHIKLNKSKWQRDSGFFVCHKAVWEKLSKFVSEEDVNQLRLSLVFVPDHWPEDTATIY